MKKVKGIGGVFFKSKDVASIKEWYRDNLGFKTTQWGASIGWGDIDPAIKNIHHTEWSPFKDDTDHFSPSTLPFMINYRVHDLRELVDVLRSEGVNIVSGIDEYEYGKFAWIMDPEGRKLELWQPIDTGLGDPPPVWNDHVRGIGGLFFKSDDPAKLKAWYKKHLGIDERFPLRDLASNKETYVVWAPLDNNDKLFAETEKPYVYGYRVRDLTDLLDELKRKGIQTSGKIESIPEGKFAWTIDSEGNKALLWQP